MPLMACGCSSNGATREGKPVCAVHIGIDPDAETVVEVEPSMEGRVAMCSYCKRTVPSRQDLPFYTFNKNGTVDGFYDGCRGWD